MARIARTLPIPRLVDGAADTSGERFSGYGERYTIPFGPRQAVDEGSYRIFRNATPGTGIAGHAAPTTMDNTKPFIMLKGGPEKRTYLDYIKLVVTAAGTAGTLNYATHLLDQDAGYTSGGEALVAVNPNGELATNHGLIQFNAGAVVATAGGDQRIVSSQRARTVIPVVGDVLLFKFGGEPMGSGMALESTTELERIIVCPPIILAPSQFYKLVLWRASQSAAASYEAEVGLWER
jgi:hypothetical protein